MSTRLEKLTAAIEAKLSEKILKQKTEFGELTIEVAPKDWVEVCLRLRDDADFAFEQLIDLCGVDYLDYGKGEWATDDAANEGFSRGVEADTAGRLKFGDDLDETHEGPRFAVVAHLISYSLNHRIRVKTFAENPDFPVVDSVTSIWTVADWFEREAFDLYGIIFEGHHDLRRILTDYGFIGHPFRKDFPMVGNVEMRYDPEKARVVYEPVTIEPRVLVPRVVRKDMRYEGQES